MLNPTHGLGTNCGTQELGRAKVHLSGGEEFGGRELGCYCYKIIV